MSSFCTHSDFCTICPLLFQDRCHICSDHRGALITDHIIVRNGKEEVWSCVNGKWDWYEVVKHDRTATDAYMGIPRRVINGVKCEFTNGNWRPVEKDKGCSDNCC